MNTSKTKLGLTKGEVERHIPQVNLNGTGKQSLMDEVYAAVAAVREARAVVAGMTVHGRDFQTVAEGEYTKAVYEQVARLGALDDLEEELTQYYLAIDAQGN